MPPPLSLKHSWLPAGGGAWWGVGEGGGLLQPSDHEMIFGRLPSTTAIRTCCQEVIPGDFISILQLVSLSFAGLFGGAAQTVGRDHPKHPTSHIPQGHAGTGSSKLGYCRRNPPKRHFREARSPCRDMPAIPRHAAPTAGRGRGRNGVCWGSHKVGSSGHTRDRRPGLRGAQLCRWQQLGTAGPGQLRGFCGSIFQESSLARRQESAILMEQG